MENKETNITKHKNKTVNSTLNRVSDLIALNQIEVPEGYHPQNAVMAAAIMLQEKKDKNGVPVLDSCSPSSIANSLLEMVVKGFNPMSNHCYLIPRHGELVLEPSYFGYLMLCKRDSGLLYHNCQIIYENEKFSYGVDKNDCSTVILGA